MKYKEITQTTEYKNDNNQCTIVASSVAFNIDYKKVHKFYMANGRKKNRGLLPYHTEKLIRKLAKLEGFKVTTFKPRFIAGNIRKWVAVDGKSAEILLTISKHLTPNNQSLFLPKGNYIMGVSGHVIGIKNGIVHDWTSGGKHRAKVLYKIEKIGKKVKRQTFPDAYDDWMNFKF